MMTVERIYYRIKTHIISNYPGYC